MSDQKGASYGPIIALLERAEVRVARTVVLIRWLTTVLLYPIHYFTTSYGAFSRTYTLLIELLTPPFRVEHH